MIPILFITCLSALAFGQSPPPHPTDNLYFQAYDSVTKSKVTLYWDKGNLRWQSQTELVTTDQWCTGAGLYSASMETIFNQSKCKFDCADGKCCWLPDCNCTCNSTTAFEFYLASFLPPKEAKYDGKCTITGFAGDQFSFAQEEPFDVKEIWCFAGNKLLIKQIFSVIPHSYVFASWNTTAKFDPEVWRIPSLCACNRTLQSY